MNTPTPTRASRIIAMFALVMLVAVAVSPRIIMAQNQSGSSISDSATSQIRICRATGGTAEVFEERNVGSGLLSVTVLCRGGVLDGWLCVHWSGELDCGWANPWGRAGEEDVTVSPGVNEAPPETPTPTPLVANEGVQPELAEDPATETPGLHDDIVVTPGDAEEPSLSDPGREETFPTPTVAPPVLDPVVTPIPAIDPGT